MPTPNSKERMRHTHSFSVDSACECGIMLSVLIRKQQEALNLWMAYAKSNYSGDGMRAIETTESIFKALDNE